MLLEGSYVMSLVLRWAWLLEAASDSSGIASSLGGVPPTLVIICAAKLLSDETGNDGSKTEQGGS